MTVFRDDAVADDLGALRKVSRKRYQHRSIDGADDGFARLSFGIDERDGSGHHGFIEAQLHHLRGLRHHAAVAGITRYQRRMRRGGFGDAGGQQQGHGSQQEGGTAPTTWSAQRHVKSLEWLYPAP